MPLERCPNCAAYINRVGSCPNCGQISMKMVKPKPDLAKALSDFYRKLEASQVSTEPEIQKMVDENFWELITETSDTKPSTQP